MTNLEWLIENHEDLIKEMIGGDLAVLEDGPHLCDSIIGCKGCIFAETSGSCVGKAKKWLDEPHEEYMIPADTPIDTKVLVSDNNTSDALWSKRYFAGFTKRNGEIFYQTFADGTTSWSAGAGTGTIDWRYCKLAE